jgi:hypothetical protein
MAKKPTEARRKLIQFDAQTWHALTVPDIADDPELTLQKDRAEALAIRRVGYQVDALDLTWPPYIFKGLL